MKRKIKVRDLVGDLSYEEIKERKWWVCRYSSFRTGDRFVLTDYALSSKNEVIRISHKNKFNSYKGKIMIRRTSIGGYWCFSLSYNGKENAVFLHRLKWETRKGWISERMQINHIDGNKKNNKFNNLEVVTPGENNKHAIRTGLRKIIKGKDHYMFGKHPSYWDRTGKNNSMFNKHHSKETCKKIGDSQRGEKNYRFGKKGEDCLNSKLSKAKVKKILYSRYKDNLSYKEIIKLHDISNSTVIRIVNGYFWNPNDLTKQELIDKYAH